MSFALNFIMAQSDQICAQSESKFMTIIITVVGKNHKQEKGRFAVICFISGQFSNLLFRFISETVETTGPSDMIPAHVLKMYESSPEKIS